MTSFNMSNGTLRGSFGGYDGQNDYGSNMSYQDEYKPQIYRVRRFDQIQCICAISLTLIHDTRRFTPMSPFMNWK